LLVLHVNWKDVVVVLEFYTFCVWDVEQHAFVGKGINRMGSASVLFKGIEGTLGAAFERIDQSTKSMG
jgi:hypothetical protein